MRDRDPVPYDENFFSTYRVDMRGSARSVVPVVLDLVGPESVIDVGCGEGVWLAEFIRLGARTAVGLDGDYIDRSRLVIPEGSFRPTDLSRPFGDSRRYSLVVCLEVAEHLQPEVAGQFVECLVGLGDLVLFSAAIPFQGGTHHVNLRWQHDWAALFAQHGYRAIDAIRPLIWELEEVSFWYRQNLLLYAADSRLEADPGLRRLRDESRGAILSVVHPTLLTLIAGGCPTPDQLDRLTLGDVLPRLPGMVVRALGERLRRWRRTKFPARTEDPRPR